MVKEISSGSEKTAPSSAARFTGFGASTTFNAHLFKVNIPPGRAGVVTITEEYGFLEGFEGTPTRDLRAQLCRSKWTPVADASRKDFNARLRARKVPPWAWKPHDNLLDRMLGRELCILVWAAEHASEGQLEVICRKWAALRPEERWWLYAMTAAEGGQAEDKERGWRKALYYALSDGETSEDPEVVKARRAALNNGVSGSLFG